MRIGCKRVIVFFRPFLNFPCTVCMSEMMVNRVWSQKKNEKFQPTKTVEERKKIKQTKKKTKYWKMAIVWFISFWFWLVWKRSNSGEKEKILKPKKKKMNKRKKNHTWTSSSRQVKKNFFFLPEAFFLRWKFKMW